jgi:hypothetical protein
MIIFRVLLQYVVDIRKDLKGDFGGAGKTSQPQEDAQDPA